MTEASAVELLIAKQQLAELTMAYCRGVDRADVALLRSIFHDDSVVESGVFNGSGSDFAVEICAIVQSAFHQTAHMMTNQWFQVDGDDAVGESYVFGVATPRSETDRSVQMLSGGRYLDRFARRGGVWKFSERRYVSDWAIHQPSGGPDDVLRAPYPLRGVQGADDPVHHLWQGPGQ